MGKFPAIVILIVLVVSGFYFLNAPSSNLIHINQFHVQLNQFSCIPAVIQTIFEYYNKKLNQDDIWDFAGAKGLDFDVGLHPNIIFELSKAYGLEAFAFVGEPISVKRLLIQNVPVIYAIRKDHVSHALVFLGFDDKKELYYFFDPMNEGLRQIDYAQAGALFKESFYLTYAIVDKKIDLAHLQYISKSILDVSTKPLNEQIPLFERLRSDGLHSPILEYNLAFAYNATQAYEKSIQICIKLLAQYGEHSGVLNLLGNIYENKLEFSNALECFRRAASISIYSALPNLNLIALLYNQNRFDQALQEIDKLRYSRPDFLPLYHYLLHIQIKRGVETKATREVYIQLCSLELITYYGFFKKYIVDDLNVMLPLANAKSRQKIQNLLDKMSS